MRAPQVYKGWWLKGKKIMQNYEFIDEQIYISHSLLNRIQPHNFEFPLISAPLQSGWSNYHPL